MKKNLMNIKAGLTILSIMTLALSSCKKEMRAGVPTNIKTTEPGTPAGTINYTKFDMEYLKIKFINYQLLKSDKAC